MRFNEKIAFMGRMMQLSNENIYNEFARMGYTEEQSQKLCELAIKYPSTIQETNQNELLEAMIKALSFHNDKLNDLERLTEFMNKETIKTQIEEWFCDADCEDEMFAVAELYALLYSEAKRNLRCWSDTYEKIKDEE